jgi:hypothetical protein
MRKLTVTFVVDISTPAMHDCQISKFGRAPMQCERVTALLKFCFGTSQSCCDMLKKPWQFSTTSKEKTLYLAHVQIHQMISAPEEIDCDLCDISAKKGPCDM